MNTYFDNLTSTVQHFQEWDDTPSHLLPLVLSTHAALLSGFEAGHSADGWAG